MQKTQSATTATSTVAETTSNPNPVVPWLVTVKVLAGIYAEADETESAIRANIFKAEDRRNSRGEVIPGNGLAAHGAVIRRGRKVLVDANRYGDWLAGRTPKR